MCQIGALYNNGVYVLYKLLQMSLMIGGRCLFDADFDPIPYSTKLVSKFLLMCHISWMMQPRVDDIFFNFLMFLIMVLLLPLCEGIIDAE